MGLEWNNRNREGIKGYGECHDKNQTDNLFVVKPRVMLLY